MNTISGVGFAGAMREHYYLSSVVKVQKFDELVKLRSSDDNLIEGLDIVNDAQLTPRQLYDLLIRVKQIAGKYWGIGGVASFSASLVFIPYSVSLRRLLDAHKNMSVNGACMLSSNKLLIDLNFEHRSLKKALHMSFEVDMIRTGIGNELSISSMSVKGGNTTVVEKICTPANMGTVFAEYFSRFLI